MEGGEDELRFLGRVARKTSEGYEWESDDEHQKILLKESGLE